MSCGTEGNAYSQKKKEPVLLFSARKTLVKFAQLLARGLPGNLLGEGTGGVKSGRRERRCHSGCSVKYVGRWPPV